MANVARESYHKSDKSMWWHKKRTYSLIAGKDNVLVETEETLMPWDTLPAKVREQALRTGATEIKVR